MQGIFSTFYDNDNSQQLPLHVLTLRLNQSRSYRKPEGKIHTKLALIAKMADFHAQMPITKENAQEMARRSHEAQRKKAQQRRNLSIVAESAIQIAAMTVQQHTQGPMQINEVSQSRVIEYEEHLKRLKGMLGTAKESADIYRLTQAIAKLEEVYCQYANIPKPGQLKPSATRSSRRQPQTYAPIEPDQPSQ